MNNVKNRGCYGGLNVKEGVPYIYTENGLFILPQFWGLYEKAEKPVGVALKEGAHGVLVALKGSESFFKLFNEFPKDVPVKNEEYKNDWNGKGNTELFVKAGSPAAKFCSDYGTETIKRGNWWLPSYAEMELMCRHKDKVDACLAVCSGSTLYCAWHWTSTQVSSRSGWMFYWAEGSTVRGYKCWFGRVRPVSCFPE